MKGLAQSMKLPNKLQRSLYVAVAFVLVTVSLASGWVGHAAAATQVTTRSIKMSSSNQGATGVTYKVTFTAQSSYTVKGIVVDFCDNTPLPGDSCNAPTGFNITATPTIANASPAVSWTAAGSNPTGGLYRTLTLTDSTGTALTANTTVVSFEITSVTNPTTDNHSFYARIFTYTSTTTGYTTGGSGNEGSYTEYGGIAMSTGKVINITARVMETLTFCVYSATCGDDPSFTIGHTVGTTTVIDNTAVDTGTASFSISTNANGGASIRLKGDTLKSGTNDINPAGAAAITFAAGTENFGFRLSTAGASISGQAPYDGGSGTQYGLVVTGGGAADVTSTYGGLFATLSGPVNASVSTLTFAATASLTTTAGTYTAAEQLIAAGTF